MYRMAMFRLIILFTSFLFKTTLSQTCSSPLMGVVEGNIRLGFLFPFLGKNGEFCSSEVVAENIALIEAAIYAVKNLPDNVRIPGVTIGLEAFDSCSSAGVGIQNVLKYIDNQLYSLNGSLCDDVILRPGIIGPMAEEVTQAVSPLLSYQNIPLILYGATSAALLEDRDKHGSLLNLVPSEKIQAQVLVDVLWNMKWDYVGVLYSHSMGITLGELQTKTDIAGICLVKIVRIELNSNEAYVDAINSILGNPDIKVVVLLLDDAPDVFLSVAEAINDIGETASNLHWVSNVEPLSQLQRTYKNVLRGLVAIKYSRQINNGFKDYINSLNPSLVSEVENPWFTRSWETINQCDLMEYDDFGVPCNQTSTFTSEPFSRLDISTSNIIDSVYVYAEALAKLHKEVCGEVVGICELFGLVVNRELLDKLLEDEFMGALNQTIVFEDNGEPKHVEFEITNIQMDDNGNSSVVKVGVWDSDTGINLNITAIQLWTSSEKLESIPISCPEPCIDLSCLPSASSSKSFASDGDVIFAGMFSIHDVNCSGFKTSEYTRMQAMLYAIQSINEDSKILPNMTIGVEVFDTCSDSKIAGANTFGFAAGFQNNADVFMKRERSGRQEYAIGVIGAGENDITKSINDQLFPVDVVQIGYLSTASNNELNLIYHVVGTDKRQSRVIIDILLRAEYKYIQIIGNKYANEAVNTLKDLANKAGIAIANSLVADVDTSFDDIVHRLLAYPTANVVVIFLEKSETNQFLEALGRKGIHKQFQIIASDKWGLDPSVVDGVESFAEDSITISPKAARNSDFESYFTRLHPNNAVDPWFAEFWMERHKCQLPGKPIVYDESCSDSNVLIIDDAQSRTVSSVIDSVYVLATALDLLVRDKCPEEGNICTNIASLPMDKWLAYIDQTVIESSSGSGIAIKFDGNREVSHPVYDVNKYEGLNSEFNYQTIGSWQEGIGLEDVDAIDFKSVASACYREVQPCFKSNPRLSIIDGDITIPALFSIHTSGDSSLMCGSLSLEQVVAAHALIYAVEEINKDIAILPELTLGAAIADYCESSLLAYEQFLNVISNTSRYGHDFAVFGPVDTDVASTLVPSAINQLGFSSVVPYLLNNDSESSFPFYISTKPPSDQIVSTLSDLVRYFKWTYIAIVFTDAPSERYQAELFIKKMKEMKVCVAVNGVMPVDGNRLKMDEIISQISTTAGVGVAVLFLSEDHFSLLLESKTAFGTNAVNVMWIGSFPSAHDFPSFKDSNMATLSVSNYQYNLTDFRTYLTSLNPLQDNGNPWFAEYFEIIAECRIYNDYTSSVPVCDEGMTLKNVEESRLKISDLVSNTIKSVYMIAQAAHNRLLSVCGKNPIKICSTFLEHDPSEVYNAISNIEIHPSMSKEPIRFQNGIIEEKIIIVNQLGGHNPEELQVGHWVSGTLSIDVTNLKSYDVSGNIQEGVSSSECPSNDCQCSISPETTEEPDDLKSESIEWNVEGYWVTIVLAVSGTCSVLMLLTIGYLCYYRRTTVVIEASLSLSIWVIIGLILMYVMNLAFMVKPTVIVCGVRRVGISFVYAVVFSALSVKIIRINRLRRRLVPEEPIGFTGAPSQTLFFFIFLMAEIVLVAEWLIFDHPETVLNSNNETECSFEKLHLVLSLSYAGFLVIFSLLVSLGALNSSSVNSEARFIFLACLSTICCVSAWTCVYVLADDSDTYEVPSVCVGLTLNATLIFVAIFFPKVNALCDVYSKKTAKPARSAKMGQAYANTALALHTNEEEALTNL